MLFRLSHLPLLSLSLSLSRCSLPQSHGPHPIVPDNLSLQPSSRISPNHPDPQRWWGEVREDSKPKSGHSSLVLILVSLEFYLIFVFWFYIRFLRLLILLGYIAFDFDFGILVLILLLISTRAWAQFKPCQAELELELDSSLVKSSSSSQPRLDSSLSLAQK